MATDIDYLHHVAHIVENMQSGLELYDRLGFTLPPPSYYTLQMDEDSEPTPIGATNTHSTLRRNFVELVSYVRRDGPNPIPEDAKFIPLSAPPGQLERMVESLSGVADMFVSWLSQFEGLHIIAFHTADIEAVEARLDAIGVKHGGLSVAGRTLETEGGAKTVQVRLLELQGEDPAKGSQVPEGRIVIAEDDEALVGSFHVEHPNGAIDLVEAVLCVPDAQMEETQRRYEKVLGRSPRQDGAARVFDLGDSRVLLVDDDHVESVLPGQRPPGLPALVAYAVRVQDLGTTRKVLDAGDVPYRSVNPNELMVPSEAAMGVTVLFREA